MKRRIAVVGDKLTSGGHILDYIQQNGFTFHGHKAALLGAEAFCTACKRTGILVKNGEAYRLGYEGSQTALHDDFVLCSCPTPPRINATLALESWCEVKERGGAPVQSGYLARAADPATSICDEQYTLIDHTGRPLSGVRYRAYAGSRVVASGITDADGKTARIKTDTYTRLRLEIAH